MNAIGQPISRVDGRRKVTGSARYTADIPAPAAAHAAIVHSKITKERTVSIDASVAERALGVLAVLTHQNMPRMHALPWSHIRPQGQTYLPLQDDKIDYAGQPVAIVVAETLDQAAYAGTLIEVEYKADQPVVFRPEMVNEAVVPMRRMWPLASSIGDADEAIVHAAIKIERVYKMPDRHHNPDRAARDPGRVGRRRDAHALRLHADARGHAEARVARSRCPGGEDQRRVRVSRRRLRRQVVVLAAHVGGRSCGEGGGPAGPLAADPHADVLNGWTPGRDRSDDRARRRSRREARRYPPRQWSCSSATDSPASSATATTIPSRR
jgi:CO/xanthine dehydrogenase Mo-binding subunit